MVVWSRTCLLTALISCRLMCAVSRKAYVLAGDRPIQTTDGLVYLRRSRSKLVDGSLGFEGTVQTDVAPFLPADPVECASYLARDCGRGGTASRQSGVSGPETRGH